MTEHSLTRFTNETLASLLAAGRDFTDHSIFSPSGSSMWANCAGSLIPNLYAHDTAGIDAAYGTVGHGVAETWGKTGECPDHLIGTVQTVVSGDQTFEIEIDGSMMEFVEQYINRIIFVPGEHFWERRVDFSDLTPIKKQRGTLDHGVCRPGELEIDDLKLGKSEPIPAKGNTQLVMYAYGVFAELDWQFDFQTITMRIHQPRLSHFDEWTITRAELLEWADRLKQRAYAAWCQDAERSPGAKQCRWCKVKTGCAAHAAFIERLVDGVFDNLDAPVTADDMQSVTSRIDSGLFSLTPITVGSLTTPQKAVMLPFRKMIESWFADLAEDLERRLLSGETVPGYKIVDGKSFRVFTSDEEAEEVLEFLGLPEAVIHPRGMISPAQAEAELTKIGYKRKQLPGLLNAVVRKPPGKPTMAPESDKRPAIAASSDGIFSNLDDDL